MRRVQILNPPMHILALLLLVAAAAYAHGPGAANDFGGRRILLIGIDGTRADAVQRLVAAGRAPHLKSLIATGAVTWNGYAGGEPGAAVLQDTNSGPGWASVLTGVWREQHGVADNRFRTHRIAEHPHFMRLLKAARPSAWVASLCDWPEIHYHIAGASQQDGCAFLDYQVTAVPEPTRKGTDYGELDTMLTARAVAQLRDANPDALFMYFGNVDETGHAMADQAGRFSPDNEPYLAALAHVDSQIGELLAALRARPKYAGEKWLILATTDHGGRGTTHGGQSPEERTIWMVANGGDVPRGVVIPGPVPQTAIAPTIFRHLGVAAPAAWTARPFALPDPPARK